MSLEGKVDFIIKNNLINVVQKYSESYLDYDKLRLINSDLEKMYTKIKN